MPSTNSYLDVARDYAQGVRVLFASSGVPTGERGGVGPASADDLAAQAEKVSEVSAKLTRYRFADTSYSPEQNMLMRPKYRVLNGSEWRAPVVETV